MTTLFFFETLVSGKPKYSLVLVLLLPPTLEPLLDRVLQFRPQSNLGENPSQCCKPSGSGLCPLFADFACPVTSPMNMVHSPPCTADSSPDFPEVQIPAVTCSSDSSTWILRRCNVTSIRILVSWGRREAASIQEAGCLASPLCSRVTSPCLSLKPE